LFDERLVVRLLCQRDAGGTLGRTLDLKRAPSAPPSALTCLHPTDSFYPDERATMLEAIEKLLILQDRDRKLFRIREELAHIEPQQKALNEKAAKTQAGFESAKLKGKQIESERKRLELEVDSLKEKINKYSVQQFQTKKNEEFRAIGHEIENAKAEIFKIEDQQIDLMEQAEVAQKQVVDAQKTASEAKKLVDDQLAQLAGREANLKKELAEVTADREQLAAGVDDTTRSRYERLLKNKGGTAIVGIQHGVCGGCHMRFPPQIMIGCKKNEEIVTCPNCGRILYYTTDMDMVIAD
jgi:predicted  nucleic acid-binding Zn-ribbon protein